MNVETHQLIQQHTHPLTPLPTHREAVLRPLTGIHAVLFDVYAGQGISSGKRSLAYRVTLQSSQGTLTTQQVNQAQQEILETLHRETGATLRG